MVFHVSLDDLFLVADALLDLLLICLEFAEKVNLVLDGGALVEEALGQIVEVDGHEPEVSGRITPVVSLAGVRDSRGVGGKSEKLDLAGKLLERHGETSSGVDGLVVDLPDVDSQELGNIIVGVGGRVEETGGFPGQVEVVVGLMFASGLV